MIAPPYETLVYIKGTNPFAINAVIRGADVAGLRYEMGTDEAGPLITTTWVKLRAQQPEPIRDVIAALMDRFGAQNVEGEAPPPLER